MKWIEWVWVPTVMAGCCSWIGGQRRSQRGSPVSKGLCSLCVAAACWGALEDLALLVSVPDPEAEVYRGSVREQGTRESCNPIRELWDVCVNHSVLSSESREAPAGWEREDKAVRPVVAQPGKYAKLHVAGCVAISLPPPSLPSSTLFFSPISLK